MKLKAKIEEKDLIIFIFFCLFLFYIVAVGFLNVVTFIGENQFHGFNPFPAISRQYFAPVMVIFILFLIVIFNSISSHIFHFEKGVGFSFGSKETKGYTRWANDKEMKAELKKVIIKEQKSDYAGIPLINNGRELWVDDGEHHSIIVGATGSGKTQAVVHPMVKVLAKKGESMILTDPKGEIYEENAEMLKEKGYNIVLLNFRQPQRGNSWNPLQLPFTLYKEGNQDKANELLDDLAMNILYDEAAQGQDPFWERTSADYFAGLALSLFEDGKKEEINLNSINYMTTAGEEKSLGTTFIKEYFSHKDPTSPAYVNVVSTLMAPSETKSSILSVFKQKIKMFSARENLSEMLAFSDFDIKDIGREKTAVFLLIHDEKKTYHSLLTIFIKQCYEALIDVAQESGGQLRYRTNFILDEFANMPPLKDVTTMVTAARSRNIRFNFFIQNFSQLYQVYGKENGETIKGNCGNLVYLISTELAALEEISKLCGEEKKGDKDKVDSKPLISVSDLQRLKKWEAVILHGRLMPYKTKLTPNFKIDWGQETVKAEYIVRPKNSIAVFDIKKFVEEKRKNLFAEANKSLEKKQPGIQQGPQRPTSIQQGQSTQKPPNKGVDLDALIQRMDEKIAELEKEEAEKRKKTITGSDRNLKPEEKVQRNAENFMDLDNLEDIDDEIEEAISEPKIEENQKEEKFSEPKVEFDKDAKKDVNVQKEPKKKEDKKQSDFEKNEENIKTKKTEFVTDDQFFDDFFGDD